MFGKKEGKLEEEEKFPSLNKRIAYVSDGIKTSLHLLKGGSEEPYFVDFDKITQNPEACRVIGEWFKYVLDIITENEGKPDILTFIEKEGIGTVGAISFSAYLSVLSNIPHIFYRENRRCPYEKIKISERYESSKKKRLKNKVTVIISDVATTGYELKNAVHYIKREGGEIKAILLYFSRLKKETVEYFLKEGITIYYLLNQPLVRKFAWEENTKEAKKIRNVFIEIDKKAERKGHVLFTYKLDSR